MTMSTYIFAADGALSYMLRKVVAAVMGRWKHTINGSLS